MVRSFCIYFDEFKHEILFVFFLMWICKNLIWKKSISIHHNNKLSFWILLYILKIIRIFFNMFFYFLGINNGNTYFYIMVLIANIIVLRCATSSIKCCYFIAKFILQRYCTIWPIKCDAVIVIFPLGNHSTINIFDSMIDLF